MWWKLYYAGGGHAISAILAALWDVKFRRLGLPLWRLLDGYNLRGPVYTGGIDPKFP